MSQDQTNSQASTPIHDPTTDFQIRVDFPNQPAPNSAIDDGDVDFGLLDNVTGGVDAADQISTRSQSAIEAAMSTIRAMAHETDQMRKRIPELSQPNAIKVKFGINLDFEVGAFLARSGVGATMEVELEWRNDES